ncbi:MAG TPA: AgmX/PglI C-terminal domain-containing protein [Candidatus Binatia bacterium]
MKNRGMGAKGIVGLGGCLLGLATVYFGSGVGTESPKKEAAARASATDPEESNKPLRAMNFALDNMVFFAQELGFNVINARDEAVSESKIALRIENQLQNVRELYRGEIKKNPSLAGVIFLQLEITPSGEVVQIKETGSKLADSEFKKAVIAEVDKWSFNDVVSESLKVNCPLLFVHQGMDITTLVRWEKATAIASEKSMVQPAPMAKGALRPGSSLPANVKTTSVPMRAAPANPASGPVYQIKYATLLRKEPNFSAPALTSLTIGTKVVVQKKIGDWLEVRSADGSQTGYIRKEFLTPLDVTAR